MSNFRLLPYFVCFATVISLVKVSSSNFNVDDRNGKLRLNDLIKPTAYVLRLVPDLSKFTFFGKVEISIWTEYTTNRIFLHSKKLTIKSVTVQLKKDKQGTPMPNIHEFDEANDLLNIRLISPHQDFKYQTEYSLVIEFEGEIGENLEGFYRSSYVFDDKKSLMAITHFEPNHARQAFPCFDEPRFKTPFTIYIARSASQLAWSSMPTDSWLPSDSISGADRIWQKFETSPPMPTHWVSYMILEFSSVTNTENNIEHTCIVKNLLLSSEKAIRDDVQK